MPNSYKWSVYQTYLSPIFTPPFFYSVCVGSQILSAQEVLLGGQCESEFMSYHRRCSQGSKILKKG